METSSYLASLFYNVFRSSPISTYGDLCAATLQNFLIITLVWLWGIDKKPFTIFHISSVIFVFGLFTAIVFQLPQEYHKYIATYSIILITLSRLPQILSNFLHGQVGVQSIITITNSVLGATAKLFITIIETNDIYLIAGSALSLLLNSVLLLQIFIIEHQIVKKDPIEISKVNADAADNNKKKDTMIDSKSIKGPKGIRQKKAVK
jgi:mannose-P-dolichol utilization defect protein 1